MGGFLAPDDRERADLLEDYERGSLALNDPSGGLAQANWRAFVSGKQIFLGREGGTAAVVLVTDADPTEISLAFDSAMNPQLAWMEGDQLKFRWYDTVAEDYVIETFPGARDPRLCLDDKRAALDAWRDVLLIYVKTGPPLYLAYRQQRDRFETEYLLTRLPENLVRLGRVGMASGLRLQIEYLTPALA